MVWKSNVKNSYLSDQEKNAKSGPNEEYCSFHEILHRLNFKLATLYTCDADRFQFKLSYISTNCYRKRHISMVTNIIRMLILQLITDLQVYNEGWIIFNFLKAQSLVPEKIPQLNRKTSNIVLIFLCRRQGPMAFAYNFVMTGGTFPVCYWQRYLSFKSVCSLHFLGGGNRSRKKCLLPSFSRRVKQEPKKDLLPDGNHLSGFAFIRVNS